MIIGLTGTFGAGKGTVVDFLVNEKGFKHIAVSDTFLVHEAQKRGLEPTRIVRRDIANEYRSQGPAKLMEAVYGMAKPLIDAGQSVVIEPQHTEAEVAFIQSIGGEEWAIDADLPTRYQRIKIRNSAKDHVTFEQFQQEQIEEMRSDNPDKNNLGAAIARANRIIRNDGSVTELFAQVSEALATYHA